MTTLRWILASIILLTEFFFIVKLIFFRRSRIQYLIKDLSSNDDILTIPYSYSRTQLVWWTFLILPCLSISFAVTGTIDGLPDSSLLVLLGISVATTAGGSIIDNSDIQKENKKKKGGQCGRHQDEPSEGFFNDILSDSNGISIHRFQALVFNLLYGFIFIEAFVHSGSRSFVHFDEFTLGLIGLSTAGYITLKSQENR